MGVVAMDVGSGERGADALVDGALAAVRADASLECILVGRTDEVRRACPNGLPERTRHVASDTTIAMADDPVAAVRNRRDSSVVACARLVQSGAADAMVSSANTGAVVLAGGACLRRIPGVLHPALAAPFPRPGRPPALLVDCGASVVRDAEWLTQYAALGAECAHAVFGLQHPKVGLVANGVEAIKGDDIGRDADVALRARDDYVGFVEPWEMLTGSVDVLVSDGFTGNLVLKSLEVGASMAILEMLAAFRDAADDGTRERLARAQSWTHVELGSGGLLLGVRGVVVKMHGENGDSSDVARAIRLATVAVAAQVPERCAAAVGNLATVG